MRSPETLEIKVMFNRSPDSPDRVTITPQGFSRYLSERQKSALAAGDSPLWLYPRSKSIILRVISSILGTRGGKYMKRRDYDTTRVGEGKVKHLVYELVKRV